MLVGSRETSHTNRLDRISAKHLQLCTCLHRTDGGRRRAASRRPGLQTKMFVKGCQVASCSKLTSGYLWLVERKHSSSSSRMRHPAPSFRHWPDGCSAFIGCPDQAWPGPQGAHTNKPETDRLRLKFEKDRGGSFIQSFCNH